MNLRSEKGISIDADSVTLKYFNAVVVEVKKNLLLFRLALAILCVTKLKQIHFCFLRSL